MGKTSIRTKDKTRKLFSSFRFRKNHFYGISSLKHLKLPVGFDLDSEIEAAFQKLSPEEKARVENGDLAPVGRTGEPNPKEEIFLRLEKAITDGRLDQNVFVVYNSDPDAALAKVPDDVARNYSIPKRVPKRILFSNFKSSIVFP